MVPMLQTIPRRRHHAAKRISSTLRTVWNGTVTANLTNSGCKQRQVLQAGDSLDQSIPAEKKWPACLKLCPAYRILHILQGQAYIYPHAHPYTWPLQLLHPVCILSSYIVSITTTSSKKAKMGTPLKQEKLQIAKSQILLPEIKSQMFFIVR